MKLEGNDWIYSKKVKEHFLNPKNFLKNKKEIKDFDGHGVVGNMKCGDLMEMWIKVKNDKIIDVKWSTFGCASAIASTSILSEMLKEKGGTPLKKALKITGKDITKRLGGLPAIKIHCSVLGDQALRAAIYDYAQKNNRTDLKVEKPLEEEHH
ncbi:MAG: iron-sulfur cluster assembly scaffold protein [Candidatus Iainarchaeum sp.]|jgi:NifU-like protein involved in Fe-S cluster formation|nr:MAG: scaffold protein [archaeon ADurb.Bin336]